MEEKLIGEILFEGSKQYKAVLYFPGEIADDECYDDYENDKDDEDDGNFNLNFAFFLKILLNNN